MGIILYLLKYHHTNIRMLKPNTPSSAMNLMQNIRTMFKALDLWLVAVVVIGGWLRFSRLGDFDNQYYTATVASMIQSSSNFFFASFDPGGTVMVDKPPLSFWVQAPFAYMWGSSSWSVTLPQVILGALAIAAAEGVPQPDDADAGTESAAVPLPAGSDAGIEDGAQVRLGGEGDAGEQGDPSGDLFVEIHIGEHDHFHREGQDLYTEIPLSYSQACLGDKITVLTMDSEARMTIPPGTPTGKLFRLKTQGLPRLHGGRRGDLFVRVYVHVPDKVRGDEKKLLKALAELEKDRSQA